MSVWRLVAGEKQHFENEQNCNSFVFCQNLEGVFSIVCDRPRKFFHRFVADV
jgi:hypothetical protein